MFLDIAPPPLIMPDLFIPKKPAIIQLYKGDLDHLRWLETEFGIKALLPGMVGVVAGATAPKGQQVWTADGSFVVPAGVTSISAVCVGHGGQFVNYGGGNGAGGRGGDLRYAITLAVTPGETLTITIPAVGTAAATQILRSGTPLLSAACGLEGSNVGGTSTTIGGNIGGGNGSGSNGFGDSGGGGAGGYSGNGGTGGIGATNGGNGSGGGGGGGRGGGGGGGVGLLGQGSNGSGGTSAGAPGTGGSGGGNGTTNSGFTGGNGGAYGGASGWINGGTWGVRGGGAVRIIWGTGRAYPSTGTADV